MDWTIDQKNLEVQTLDPSADDQIEVESKTRRLGGSYYNSAQTWTMFFLTKRVKKAQKPS